MARSFEKRPRTKSKIILPLLSFLFPGEEGSLPDDGEQSLRIFKEIIIAKTAAGCKKFLPGPWAEGPPPGRQGKGDKIPCQFHLVQIKSLISFRKGV
jgi:hypothetical protein